MARSSSSLVMFVFVSFYLGLSSCQIVKEDCAPTNSSFHKYCICRPPTLLDCGGNIEVEFVCSGLPEFYVEGANNSKVDCLRITNSPLVTITTDGLKQFPFLRGLVVAESDMANVSNGALDQLQSLRYLELRGNRLTVVPHINNLSSLVSMYLSSNSIEHVDKRTFLGVTGLRILDLQGNRLTSLRGNIFSANCLITNLFLSNNRIRVIEDEVFDSTVAIQVLRLANTEISQAPTHQNLRSTLHVLDFGECWNLKTFNFLTQNGNKTFPFLNKITFAYNAHCCQLKRLVEKETASHTSMQAVRKRRNTAAVEGPICVNVSSLECVSESVAMAANATWLISADNFCSEVVSDSLCSTCLDEVCSDSCNALNSSEAENSSLPMDPSSYNDVLCLSAVTSSQSQPTPQPTKASTQLMQITTIATPEPSRTSTQLTLTTRIKPTYCLNVPISTTCNPTLPAATPTPDSGCIAIPDRLAECVQMPIESSPTISTPQVTRPSTTVPVVSTIAPITPAPPTNPPIPPTTPAPPTNPPIDCQYYCISLPQPDSFLCAMCISDRCSNPSCLSMFPEFCAQCHVRKKRSADTELEDDSESRRNKRQMDLPFSPRSADTELEVGSELRRNKRQIMDVLFSSSLEWFPNYSDPFCCSVIKEELPTITVPSIRNRTCPVNSPPFETDLSDTVCLPDEDPFNPCLDLLGTSDGLRAAIWLVIILAFLGNLLVFVVFIGYSVIIRKAAQETFTIHFMYFNLALADLFMGIYLFTIAIVDANTKGEFYLSDISWRTGHGCGFAGFCAILSTVVSVYVLVVITLERTYTIVKVFKRKKLNKRSVLLIMSAGWLLGAIIAALPLLGVSNYSTVAICLPFNVDRHVDRGYVVFLLIATGLAFIIIAVCYTIIFRQIFCNPNKVTPVTEGKRRSSDAKIAVRILILILTNFVCWFPIALVGLTAAFNKSLVSNLEFARWAMVFIFPVNACLNPFLYSLTTRVFRDQLVLLLGRCGVCKSRAQKIRNAQIGITPSYSSKTSNKTGGIGDTKFAARLRSFSLVSQTTSISLLNLMNRRASETSQVSGDNRRMSFLNFYPRRSSNVSGASSDELGNARRDSAVSTGSNEAATTFYNVQASKGSLESNGNLVPDVHNRCKAKISASSLGALPEEVEFPAEVLMEEGVVKVNPVYQEESEEFPEQADRRDSGMVEDEEDEKEKESEEAEVIANVNAFHLNTMDSKKSDEDTESGSSSS